MSDPTPVPAADEEVPAPRRSWWQKALSLIGWLIAMPLWLITLGVAAALVFAWILPIQTDSPDDRRRLLQAAAIGVRIFQFHFGLGLAGIVIVSLIIRHRRLALVAFLAAFSVLGIEAWRALPDTTRPAPAATSERLRIVSANVNGNNEDVDAIADALRQVDPNVVVIIEYNFVYQRSLIDLLADSLPHQAVLQPDNAPAFLVLSDRPITHSSRRDDPAGPTRRRFEISLDDQPIAVYVVHHQSPSDIETLEVNLAQTADLVERLPAEPREAIYLGDFNASTWTPQLTSLREAGLTEAFDAAAFGRGGTWPNAINDWQSLEPIVPFGLGIRIDNLFSTSGLVATDAGVGEYMQSDHRLVWADFARVVNE